MEFAFIQSSVLLILVVVVPQLPSWSPVKVALKLYGFSFLSIFKMQSNCKAHSFFPELPKNGAPPHTPQKTAALYLTSG